MKYKTMKTGLVHGCDGCANNDQASCGQFIQDRVEEGLEDCMLTAQNIIYVKKKKHKIELELVEGDCESCVLFDIDGGCVPARSALWITTDCGTSMHYRVKIV